MLEFILIALFPLLMFYSAISDMLTMTIPNWIPLILLAVYPVLAMAIGLNMEAAAWNAMVASMVLAVGFGFFAAGWVGGGDVKLAAVASLWLGSGHVLEFLLFSAFAGGLLSILLLVSRAFALPLFMENVGWIARLHNKKEGVPYGIALGPTAAYLYLKTPWVEHVINAPGL